MNIFRLKHRNSSTKNHEKQRQINAVDFVLAYRRRRKVADKDQNPKLDEDIERRRFYRELRDHGVWVDVDDDPTVSIKYNTVSKLDWYSKTHLAF